MDLLLGLIHCGKRTRNTNKCVMFRSRALSGAELSSLYYLVSSLQSTEGRRQCYSCWQTAAQGFHIPLRTRNGQLADPIVQKTSRVMAFGIFPRNLLGFGQLKKNYGTICWLFQKVYLFEISIFFFAKKYCSNLLIKCVLVDPFTFSPLGGPDIIHVLCLLASIHVDFIDYIMSAIYIGEFVCRWDICRILRENSLAWC